MIKTAESVSPKHPDKMCDQISDGILDWCLLEDENARVAIEVMGGHGKVYVTGEITMEEAGRHFFEGNVKRIVREVTGDDNLQIEINVEPQSPEIGKGVDSGGAGDQGIMVGYACRDNPAMIPQELFLARHLCKFIYEKYPYDGKTQISINDNGGIETIVASFQNVKRDDLHDKVNEWLYGLNGDLYLDSLKPERIYCNPAGDWNKGGFDADTGLTGRKLMVDNYGPQIPIGGGAFSGKDYTKVDRSGAYIARSIACSVLNKDKEAKEVFVKLAYAIGISEPVMVTIEAVYEGGRRETMPVLVNRAFLTPKSIVSQLGLQDPIYQRTAEWGHFGNGFRWDNPID